MSKAGNSPLKICSKCVMDSSVPDIVFDEEGICSYCHLHERMEEKYSGRIEDVVEEIKLRGRGKPYDCVVGVSGGCDSTFLLKWAVDSGLRVLAVHLDNGWNSVVAEENMKNAVEKLGVDLKRVKVYSQEFLDLQLAFLKASVPDVEVPTDIGIYSTLFRAASSENIPSVLNGHSFRTEGTVPMGWTYMDGRYLEDVYRKHGSGELREYNNLKIMDVLVFSLLKRIKEYRPLEYIEYSKEEAGEILKKELGWKDYGGHHFESIYTRFAASYILVSKFGIDKRKVSYSARIRSGLMARQEALELLEKPPYPPEKVEEDKRMVAQRFGITTQEFQELLDSPVRSFRDYKSYYSILHRLRFLVKLAAKMGVVSDMVYEKYSR